MHNPTNAEIIEAAEATTRIARDMARTFDTAAEQIARAAHAEDVHNMGDLLHQIARIQTIIRQTTEDIAPERLPRTVADLFS